MKFTIVQSQHVPAGALDRAGKTDVLIVYTTENGATDHVVIPSETADNEHIAAAVRANEEHLSALNGRTLEA